MSARSINGGDFRVRALLVANGPRRAERARDVFEYLTRLSRSVRRVVFDGVRGVLVPFPSVWLVVGMQRL
jgi:hypothetical protein